MTKLKLIFTLIALANVAIAQTTIKFSVENSPKSGPVKVGVRGSEQPLSWEKTFYLAEQNGKYEVELTFSDDLTFFEYKYVVEGNDSKTIFELDGQENRLGILNGTSNILLSDTWNVQTAYDIRNLPLIPIEKLKQDAEILGTALWTLHPGVERYQDSLSYFKNLNDLFSTFEKPLSYANAYKEISKFVATIKCGHTFSSPFNQTGFINNIILNQTDKLPFGLEWLDRRLFITKNATDNSAFASGTEIVAINGILVKELADNLLKLTKGDGSNDSKRFQDLNVIGYDYYEMFDIYFPLVIPPQNETFQLSIISHDGSKKDEIVKAITRSNRNTILQSRYSTIPKTIEETWQYKVLEDNIAYLKLGTFAIWDFKIDWKKFLNNAFKEFEKSKATQLIIDIRGNEGGADEVLEELQKYILKENCITNNFEERLRYSIVPTDLQPYLFTWDKSVFDFSSRVKQNADKSFSFTSGNQTTTTYKANKKAFNGNIYVLVNAANSSATFYLAKFIQECSIGKIVGETTGGSKKGINGGNVLFLRLPNSRVEVDIPIFGQFNDKEIDEGIKPDIPIQRTIEDIKSGADGQLERLIGKIRE